MKQTFRVRVPEQSHYDTKTGKWVVIKPEFMARIEVDINVEAIATQLGRKAALAKGKRAAGLSGKVKVKFLGPL